MFSGLSGWAIREMAAGFNALFALGDKSTISWGQNCQTGELGHGESKPRSATNAVLVDALEGFVPTHVSCGVGQTLLIVDKSNLYLINQMIQSLISFLLLLSM